MSAIAAAKSMSLRVRRGAAQADAAAVGRAGAVPGRAGAAPRPGSRPSTRSILQSFVVRFDSKGRRNANDVRKVRDAIVYGERCAQACKQFIGMSCAACRANTAIGMSTLS